MDNETIPLDSSSSPADEPLYILSLLNNEFMSTSWKLINKDYNIGRSSENNIILDEDYGAAFGQSKGHYGADNLMLKDINQHLTNSEKINLPVGVKDCIEAGLVAMKIDESRKTGKIIDLSESWQQLDLNLKV